MVLFADKEMYTLWTKCGPSVHQLGKTPLPTDWSGPSPGHPCLQHTEGSQPSPQWILAEAKTLPVATLPRNPLACSPEPCFSPDIPQERRSLWALLSWWDLAAKTASISSCLKYGAICVSCLRVWVTRHPIFVRWLWFLLPVPTPHCVLRSPLSSNVSPNNETEWWNPGSGCACQS